MPDTHQLAPASRPETRRRLRVAMQLQDIEGNPFTPEDVAMFEMFEREGLTTEQQRAYVIAQAISPAPK